MKARVLMVAAGCAVAQAATPTFSKDVAPIIYKNCASCHRPGDIGPMSLLNYEQVRPWARSIREKVSLGQMPPWHATQEHGVFSNDRRLSESDKETIIQWATNGAPEGNQKDLPAAPKFTEGWEIGTPDVVISMPKPFDVPEKGTINYQYVTIPTNFTEDKWIQAIEVRPGTRAVVHHVLVFVKGPGPMAKETAFMPVAPKSAGPNARPVGSGGGPGTLIATTAPGTNAMTLEPGMAMKIAAGSSLVLQIHYTANGKAASDQSSVGMVFAKQPPQQEIHNSAFMQPMFTLKAGAADTAVDSAIEFKEDAHITALFPHTHLRGKSWEYRLTYPDGHTEVVLSVPHYDFNWQTYYMFTKPLAVPKGSRLEATAHYDNSPANKWNPDPTVDVRWGEQTWQEMQYTGITFFIDQPAASSSTGGREQR
ncbi:MAG: thiol-disulfide isomerase [Acidobacteriia bacterium]|nr:thiol-disulfide isomerase [Terriglobia bacterium]